MDGERIQISCTLDFKGQQVIFIDILKKALSNKA